MLCFLISNIDVCIYRVYKKNSTTKKHTHATHASFSLLPFLCVEDIKRVYVATNVEFCLIIAAEL